MAFVSTRTRFIAALMVLGLVMSAGALVALVDTRPEHVRAGEWAAANVGSLPSTLDDMARLSIAYRRAAFKHLTAQNRYDLWRDNLARLTASELTVEQREVILKLRDALRPEFYQDNANTKAQKEAVLRPLCQRIAQIFSLEQRRTLATLGEIIEGTPQERLITAVRHVKEFLPAYIMTADAGKAFHDCQCAEDTHCLDCQTWQYCGFPDGCSESWVGCGCASVFSCTELCESM